MIETGLTRRVVELLGFARRAGQAVCGFAKARELIASGRCGLVVQAHDGSVDERARLLSGAGALEIVTPLDAATLGVAFGRDHIVHVAIAAGRLAGSIATESGRLAGPQGRARDRFRRDFQAGRCMSDTKDQDAGKGRLSLRPGRLELGRTVNAGSVAKASATAAPRSSRSRSARSAARSPALPERRRHPAPPSVRPAPRAARPAPVGR